MRRTTVSGIMLTLLLVGMLILTFNIKPVEASRTIYIASDYTFTHNIYEPIVVLADNIVIDGNGYTLQGIGAEDSKGIDLTGRINVTIKNMKIKAFENGIWLRYSSSNSISGNNITNNHDGIGLYSPSKNNTISGNNITESNRYGILLSGSSNNSISGNNITNNFRGISLYSSPNNTLRNNAASNNKYHFDVYGSLLSHFIQDIDDSNTVDDKPVYYWVSRRNIAVPLDAGYVALVNCTGITVKNLNLTNNGQGVLLAFTTNSTIAESNITNNHDGIYLSDSSNNTLTGNDITNNGDGIWLDESSNNAVSGNNITNNHDGIELDESSNITISGNNITNNNLGGILLGWSSNITISGNNITANTAEGIRLYMSSNNIIQGNNITNNSYGIYLDWSSDSIIYHNNFVDNSDHVSSYSSTNVWDDGVGRGNYWSDYESKYPDAAELDGSGIWDTPYIIDMDNRDQYPLINPLVPLIGDLNYDFIVNMRDISLAAAAFGSYPDHPRWNPIADINQDNKVDMRDLATVARNFGKTV